jgi:predicted ester cyclase
MFIHRHIVIAGDVVVEEGTFTGTHQGVLHTPDGDIPPTGRLVAVDYIQVLRYRDGKYMSFNLMYDELPLLEQLGLLPMQQPAGTIADG